MAIFISFLVWRVGLFVLAILAPALLPNFGNRFPYVGERLVSTGLPSWIWSWGNFDGVHYLGIAQNGYAAQFTQVFFPLYPLLVAALGRIFGNQFLLAGIVISNLAFLAALFLLFKLASEEFGKHIGAMSIFLLLIFPTSFFFGSVYTEGLFLLEILASFYFAKKGNWFFASILGFFASLTRFVGVFLFPALLLEYYLQNKSVKNHKLSIMTLAWLFLIPLGLAIYMIYLAKNFGNPFYFLTAQPAFGAERSGGEIILFPQAVWRYLKILLTVRVVNLPFYNAIFEFLMTMGFLVLILISFFRTRISWALFSFLAFITPTLTGTFSSMPRYVLVCFPAFLVLAQIKNKYVISFIIFVFCLLSFVSIVLFTRGYWVA